MARECGKKMVKNWYFFVFFCKKRAFFVISCEKFVFFALFLTILGEVRAFPFFGQLGGGQFLKMGGLVKIGKMVKVGTCLRQGYGTAVKKELILGRVSNTINKFTEGQGVKLISSGAGGLNHRHE